MITKNHQNSVLPHAYSSSLLSYDDVSDCSEAVAQTLISVRSFAEFAEFAASEIKDIDWVEHVQRSWKPMNLGQGFQVLLPWHDGPSGGATSNGRLVLRLEGGAAFGLGDHPTTQGAVEFLEKALRGHRWQSFVGTAGLIAIYYIDYIVINK